MTIQFLKDYFLIQVLIHLASQTGTGQSMYEKELYEKSNILGTENIYKLLNENSNNIKKIILTSSDQSTEKENMSILMDPHIPIQNLKGINLSLKRF